MKKAFITLSLVLFALSNRVHADLMISGVFDGPLPGGLPKGVELFVTGDIEDLSVYGLGSANNGGGSNGEEFVFPAVSASAGEFIYVATEAEGFTGFFGFAPDHLAASAMSINGDDAIELFRAGELWDLFGQADVDGTGSSWEYQDGWAYRLDGADAQTAFNLSDWTFSGSNALDNETDNQSATTPVPLASYDPQASGEPDAPPEPTDPPVLTMVSAIQGTPETQLENNFGDTDVSPLIGQQVTVEAIVVGDFQNGDTDQASNLNGFYLQEESADEDEDARSSEGVFVFNADTDVALGDKVRLSATVDQFFGETQLSQVTHLAVLESHRLDDVAPASISLFDNTAVSTAQNGSYQPDLEAYEGMLVRFEDTLSITEQFQLDRFNEIKLVAGERPYQFTQLNTPDPTLNQEHLRNLGARTITYDDGRNEQNVSINALQGFAPYREATAKRMGDTIEGLTGVLDYKWAGNGASGATWRVRAHTQGVNQFTANELGNSPNPRPLVPDVDGNLTMASVNVLNFFTTLDDGSITAVGLEPRGSDNSEELVRQERKLVNMLLALDADLLGLVEIENDFDPVSDGSTAIERLVQAMNGRAGEGVYDYVYPGQQFVGTDAIAVAILYKTAKVGLAEDSQPALLDDQVAAQLPSFSSRDFSVDPIFDGPATNRVSLAASFNHKASGEVFTLAVNHFKSKGSSGLEDPGDPNFDQGDGAGFWNQRRLDAAIALNEWLQTGPTGLSDPDVAIVGDLNAYAQEAPVQRLLSEGFHKVGSDHDYSFVFDGQIGTLDYVLLSDSLRDRMQSHAHWHINADEADALDYNLDFGRDPGYFNGDSVFRSSDHDPLLVGLQLDTSLFVAKGLLERYRQLVAEGALEGVGRFRLIEKINVRRYQRLLHLAVVFEQKQSNRALCNIYRLARLTADNQTRPRDWIRGSGLSGWSSDLQQVSQSACQ